MMFPRVWWLTSIFEVLAIFRLAMISVELGVVRDKGTSGLPSVRVVEPVAGFFLLGMMLFLLFLKDVYVLTNMMNNNRAAPRHRFFALPVGISPLEKRELVAEYDRKSASTSPILAP